MTKSVLFCSVGIGLAFKKNNFFKSMNRAIFKKPFAFLLAAFFGFSFLSCSWKEASAALNFKIPQALFEETPIVDTSAEDSDQGNLSLVIKITGNSREEPFSRTCTWYFYDYFSNQTFSIEDLPLNKSYSLEASFYSGESLEYYAKESDFFFSAENSNLTLTLAKIESDSGQEIATAEKCEKACPGDIILSDGTLYPVSNIESYSENENNKAVAVVAYVNEDGSYVGMGLVAGSSLTWSNYEIKPFSDIAVVFNNGTVEFSNDTCGSDNWGAVCKADSEAENKPEKYPAFNFAINYGSTQGFTGDLASAWYLPSLYEYDLIYKNKETLQTSLTKAGGLTFSGDYWSANCHNSEDDAAYLYGFTYGNQPCYQASFTTASAIAIRSFPALETDSSTSE